MTPTTLPIRFTRLTPRATTPEYSSAGAGAFDFRAVLPEGCCVDLYTEDAYVFNTGIAMEIPEDYVLLLFSRSGHGFGLHTRLSNCVGVVDADFRGEIKIKLHRDLIHSPVSPMRINHGDRIAQGIIFPRPRIQFIETDFLTETPRGVNGFGSTGQ